MQKNDTFLIHGSKTEECIKFLHFSPLQIFGFFVIIKRKIHCDGQRKNDRERIMFHHSTHETAAPRIWRVGTLTYTAGGIAALFCWLLWGDFAWSLKERAAASLMRLRVNSFGKIA